MERRDVIIIGAGPAGSSCAKALRTAGVDALILEKEALPRYKTCSGVLYGQTQTLLKKYYQADAPESVYSSHSKFIKAEDVREWSPQRGFFPYVWEIDKDNEPPFPRVYQNIWRHKLDKWLLDQSGVEYRDNTRLHSFEANGDKVQIRVQTPAGVAEYECMYLVAADGGASSVRRVLSARTPGTESKATIVSLQSYCKILSLGSLKKDSWTTFFIPDIGDILCCCHQKDEDMCMHVGGFKGRRLRDSMEKFKKLLIEQFNVQLGEQSRDEGCQFEIAPPFVGEERVLLTGEAAGHMYLNGEGMAAAIDSGYRCGQAISASLTTGKSAKVLYQQNTKDMVAHIEKCVANMHFTV